MTVLATSTNNGLLHHARVASGGKSCFSLRTAHDRAPHTSRDSEQSGAPTPASSNHGYHRASAKCRARFRTHGLPIVQGGSDDQDGAALQHADTHLRHTAVRVHVLAVRLPAVLLHFLPRHRPQVSFVQRLHRCLQPLS